MLRTKRFSGITITDCGNPHNQIKDEEFKTMKSKDFGTGSRMVILVREENRRDMEKLTLDQ